MSRHRRAHPRRRPQAHVPLTHRRISPPTPDRNERETRVDHVLDMMVRGEWDGARSVLALAADWRCSRGAVQDYAREASGIIRHVAVENGDELKAEIVAGIQAIKRSALSQDKPDHRSALQAYSQIAELLGLNAPKRVEAAVTTASTDPQSVAEKHEALARALRAQTEGGE